MALREEIDAASRKVPDAPSTVLATSITDGDTTHAPDGNSVFDAMFANFATTATAAGTTTLLAASKTIQAFTGTTTQIVALPVVSTLTLGRQFLIINNSTGIVTVNSSGGNLVQTLPAGGRAIVTCVLITGTTAASWSVQAQIGVSSSNNLSGIANGGYTTPAALTFANGTQIYTNGDGGFVLINSSNNRSFVFDALNNAISIGGSAQFGFSSSAFNAITAANDTGFARVSAGVARITDGGAGTGRLTLGGGGAPIPVADSAARLALTSLSTGARAKQSDNGFVYEYLGGGESTTANWSIPFQSVVLEADFPKTNDTLANVTDLTLTLLAGRWYRITGRLGATQADDAIFSVLSLNGGSATLTGLQGVMLRADDTGFQQARITALSDAFQTAYDAWYEFDLTIQVNAGGTFIMQFAQGTTNVLASLLLKYSTIAATDVTPA